MIFTEPEQYVRKVARRCAREERNREHNCLPDDGTNRVHETSPLRSIPLHHRAELEMLFVSMWIRWNPHGMSGLFRTLPRPAGRVRGRWRKGGQARQPSVPPVRPAPPGPGGDGRGSCVPDAAAGVGRRLQQNGGPPFCVCARTGPIMFRMVQRGNRFREQLDVAGIPRRRALDGGHVDRGMVLYGLMGAWDGCRSMGVAGALRHKR